MEYFLRKRWPTLLWAVVVFVLALMIRLPSCYESFWVDELHTAWAIWGEFGEVSPRAAVGNQTPLYFQMMWIWKAVVGESELGLRMSSVLAVATASALLVVGVRQTTKSLAAGVSSGLVLAIETSSLFFGTEFRPYALVMLLAVIATWAAVSLLGGESQTKSGNLRLIFVAAASLATLLHPTAVVSFGVLAGVLLVVSWFQYGRNFKLQISDLISLILIAAVAFVLAESTLGESWENRSRWAAFGKVSEWRQLWVKWPWLTIAIIPALVRIVARRPRARWDIVCSHVPMLAGMLATSVFFLASYYDWVPLWHRRYFIAALPMLAWSAGASAMLVLPVSPSVRQRQVGWAIALGIAGMLFWQQGAWNQFQRTQTWGEPRLEDWRGAVAWVKERRNAEEDVMVNGALIEASEIRNLRTGFSVSGHVNERLESLKEYLRLPLAGAYWIDGAHHQDLSPDPGFLRVSNWVTTPLHRDTKRNQTAWIVCRWNRGNVKWWLNQDLVAPISSRSFGYVDVFHIRLLSAGESERQSLGSPIESEPDGGSGVE